MVVVINDLPSCPDLDLGGPNLASLVPTSFLAIRDLASHGFHVDCCLPCPPSWLQVLTTFLVILILISVVWVLHLFQLLKTFLFMVFMLIIVFLELPLSHNY